MFLMEALDMTVIVLLDTGFWIKKEMLIGCLNERDMW